MDNLIKVVNKLQDVFNSVGTFGINLPQIVAIGSQVMKVSTFSVN